MISRENDASRSKYRAIRGSSHRCSTCEIQRRDVDEIARAVTDDLIGDVDVTAARRNCVSRSHPASSLVPPLR